MCVPEIQKKKSNPYFSNWRALLTYIRRAIIDSFWSRSTGTVNNNRNLAKRITSSLSLRELELPSGCEDHGPTKAQDDSGYKAAIAALLAYSQRPGKYAETHKMWDLCRKVREDVGKFRTARKRTIQRKLIFGYGQQRNDKQVSSGMYSISMVPTILSGSSSEGWTQTWDQILESARIYGMLS